MTDSIPFSLTLGFIYCKSTKVRSAFEVWSGGIRSVLTAFLRRSKYILAGSKYILAGSKDILAAVEVNSKRIRSAIVAHSKWNVV